MLTIEDSFKERIQFETYVSLGSFDGLHEGHLSLINKTNELSKANNCKSMIFTFKNHPLSIINKELVPKLLMDNETKIRLFEKLGIDILNMVNFDENLMKISPEDFIKNILRYYNAKGIVVGFNNRFGYKNLGDIELLKKLSKEEGFDLHVVGPITFEGDIVSSSKIRHLISDGFIEKANTMLTRPFMLKGNVIKGKQLGRTIGFPTVNLDYDKRYVLPLGGVYYSIVNYNGVNYKGITNIGYNPTVNDNKLSIETYILDFNSDIYGEDIKIYFIKRMRDEKKFASLDELVDQLKNDRVYAEKQKLDDIF